MTDCICKGNLREIIKETEHLFGRFYEYKGQKYRFFGVVIAEDDYYYGMYNEKMGMRLLSCAGYIEGFDFKLID